MTAKGALHQCEHLLMELGTNISRIEALFIEVTEMKEAHDTAKYTKLLKFEANVSRIEMLFGDE